ncbi:hypothetical protein [Desulforamulus aquiferis]|uniref:Lysine biosynthesis protein LysW n=1 Tax=Desulforamulus aquiferis TaxID=1397668 RepID=A0AAW7ZHA4_9FIRM|nr:hypothetical protein [Desulforamulus aquiferis]MDO7788635.1 hypothetical protein [Desulforamulus aquiferis]RYD04368.1 hypothetical protein N752_13420 [Desulforamulus aquiferis]
MTKDTCELCNIETDFDLIPGSRVTCPDCNTEYVLKQEENHLRFDTLYTP